MNKPFWLGVIGCIFGFILVSCVFLLYFFIRGFNAAGYGPSGDSIIINIVLTGIFAALGLASSIMDTKKAIGGCLMIISAIGIFLSFFPLGALSGFFFLLGGILKLMDKNKVTESTSAQKV